jgi:CheY-like chemotaxis protein/anti-sigma regulatory factor (Ser/Thr protein kinase)
MMDRQPGHDLGGKIDASLGAVESLLDALLDISKLDAAAFRPEKRPFALQPLFDSLSTGFAALAQRHGVELAIVPTRAVVDTDPAFLRRILQNLLSNALRYGGVEGRPQRVLLGCRPEGDGLRIEVKDNGPGIAADKQSLIFEEFVRLQPENERPREERGLGLGLAIVERVARMLELGIRVSSAPGQGSTFLVIVPRAATGVAMPASSPPSLPPVSMLEAESFVLSIDNEATVREAMATLLGGWGCKVATAASQDEALQRVAAEGRLPDLVLADLHLDDGPEGGGPDGLAVVEALRAQWGREVPAALVTADRDPLLRRRARAMQVELLHKPVKPAALRALLRMRAAAREGVAAK